MRSYNYAANLLEVNQLSAVFNHREATTFSIVNSQFYYFQPVEIAAYSEPNLATTLSTLAVVHIYIYTISSLFTTSTALPSLLT